MRKYRDEHPGLSTRHVRNHRSRQKRHRPQLSEQFRERSLAPLATAQAAVYCLSLVVLVGLFPFFGSRLLQLDLTAISFGGIQLFIGHCSVIIVEIAGLVVIALFSWRHVKELWPK
jgi:hypothetical protein